MGRSCQSGGSRRFRFRGVAVTADPNNGLRRALRRARDGVALDAAEAEILLGARGDALADLCALGRAGARPGPGRRRPARRRHLLAQGVHPADPAVPRPLPLLHVRDDAQPGAGARSCRRTRCWPSRRRAPRSGCKEALFTLGDRPEDRWPAAREWLDAHGYDSTLAYVRAMAILVLEKTGLLPHLNPGVMTWAELQRLKPVAPSMGMMLETTSRRLFEDPHGAHFGSPDKDPAVRLRVLEDAGRSNVPFTTGILIGIGETPAERVDSIFEIRRIARAYGGDPGGHRPELPGQARHRDGAHARRRARRPRRDGCGGPARAGPADAHPGPAEPDRRGVPAAARGRHRRLGWRLAADARPRQPRAPVAADRGARRAHGRRRVPARRAADRLPELRAGRRALARPAGACRTSRALGRPGRPGPRRRRAGRPALAGARGRAGPTRPAGSTCTPRSTPRAARPTGAPTSTASTATGRRSRTRPSAPARRVRFDPDVAAALRARRARPGRAVRRRRAGPAALPTAPSWTRSPRWPTRCAPTSWAATSPTSSTATSTSPTSATPAAGSARSRSGAPTPTRTRCRWTSWPGAPRRRGTSAPPRSACRAASIPTCPAPRTSTSPAR